MNARSGRATIHDVAADLGVSASTVSRALTPQGTVSDATRRRVEEAAARLGYRTNSAARNLSTGRTNALGLLVPDLRNPFFAEIAKGAQNRARGRGHAVYIADTNLSAEAEIEAIEMMRRDVDGFVLCSPWAEDERLVAALQGVPTVVLHREVPGLPSVTADLHDGMRQAVSHLRALGHPRIAYVSGPAGSWNARARLSAYEAEVAEPARVVLGPVADQFEGGVSVADALLATGSTAVIAYNDITALGLVSRLTARGVVVPDRMSVIGFDGLDVATLANPLTSVSVPRARGAELAVDVLLRPGTVPTALPTQLVVRESTAAPQPTVT
ncbi:LacI family DNA-binding transcriptional regulator [Luteimicrobium sp. DT211]|uniref:LacI family DNA-binding transcriptional regulator n=1 Tax=Luteimicrobium sp. DT211 TaxID=3393412 RepID=UPI003CF42123